MSGTSADGVSAVLASFQGRRFKVHEYHTFPYPPRLREKILQALSLKTPGLSSLNFEVGEAFARAAREILRRDRRGAKRVAVIGSHGQTVYHGPRDRMPSTLQIGEPAVIAERTGIPVVSDFRARDVAAGGEGAPLVPFFDQYFFGGGPCLALQNVGGIANVTVVGRNLRTPIAFDTGPGNCLMDWTISKITQGKRPFDVGGKWAGQGRVRFNWIRKMSRHPYFKERPPKSAGREIFNEEFLPLEFKRWMSRRPADALAAVTYFTASTIAESYRRFVFSKAKPVEVLLSGGGAFNETFLRHLSGLLDPVPVRSIESIGIHPLAKEPLAFAFFGLRALQSQANHLPAATGAKGPRILGKITPGNAS